LINFWNILNKTQNKMTAHKSESGHFYKFISE